MGIRAGTAGAMEEVESSFAALTALTAKDDALAAAGSSGAAGDGVDVLGRAYGIRLERMGVIKKLQAQLSALQARDATEAMDLQHAMLPPDAPLHERTYAEMSTVEEIAGILTISSGAASAFVAQSRQVCALPPVLDALSAGTLSWQQAKIFADETENLDHPAAAALVEHLLDPNAPNPARGCPAGQLVPARLRAKVRGWRERHHPDSIEKRHRKSAADRRVEYTPDRDGMALDLRLPPSRHRPSHLEQEHGHRPRPLKTGRAPHPSPAQSRHPRHPTPHPQNLHPGRRRRD
ncbi:hypothetical protein ACLH0K_01880 [Arthrobacter sp. MPF02]|uniref:hypothetical protein n=1 Tax=Arthrobacter sp. MPF02 TaxID=3388492 RepID=UPI0039856467